MEFIIKQPDIIRKSINRTVRLQPEMFDQLSELAEKNRLSFNNVLCQCVQYALDNLDSTIGDVEE